MTPPTPAATLKTALAQQALRQKIKLLLSGGAAGLLALLAWLCLTRLALGLPPEWLRAVFGGWVALGALALAGVAVWAGLDWRRLPRSPAAWAEWLERRHPALLNQPSAALLHPETPVAREAVLRLGAIRAPLWQGSHPLLGALLCLGLVTLGPAGYSQPAPLAEKLRRALVPPTPQVFTFDDLYAVTPGPATVGAGYPLTLTLRKKHPRATAAQAVLHRLSAGLPSRDVVAFDGEKAVFHVERATETFTYAFVVGDLKSPLYRVEVRQRPQLQKLAATLLFPAYLRRPPTTVDLNNPEIFAPAGSWLSVTGAADRPLAQARFMPQGAGVPVAMSVKGSTFAGRLPLKQDGAWRLDFAAADGQRFSDGRRYMVRVLGDTPPTITALSPGDGLEVVESFPLEVYYLAQDDHLVAGVTLSAGLGGAPKPLATSGHGSPSARGRLVLPVARFVPRGGHGVISWRLTARDSRGQTATTPLFTLRVLSPQELQNKVKELASESDQVMEQFETTQQELKKSLEDLKKKSQQGKRLSGDDRLRLEQELQKQKESLRQVEALKEKLADAQADLQDSPKVDPEVVRRLGEVRRALDQVLSPELQKLIAALQKSLETLQPQQLAKAMENMMQDQEKLLQALDKTLGQLKALRQQQLLSETQRELTDLIKEQNALNQQMAKGGDAKKLAEKQRQLAQRIKQAEDKLREIGSIAQEQLTLHELRQLPDQVDKAATGQQAEQAARNLEQKNGKSAQQQGQQVSQKLAGFQKQLQQAAQGLAARQEKMIKHLVYRLAMDALTLSQEQENLLEQAGAKNFRPEAQKQFVVKSQVSFGEKLTGLSDEMADLVRASLEAPMEWLGLTHDLVNKNQSAKVAADTLDFGRANYLLQSNVQALNTLAKELLAKSGSLSSGGSGGGSLEDYLDRLGQVAAMQQQLNRQGQKPGPMGSPGMLDLLERMAQGQGKASEELQKLMKEFGQFKEMNQKVQEVMKQMEDVQKALKGGDFGQRVRSRQQDIHKRLLQLQTAMKKKEDKEKRKGERARQLRAAPPPALAPGSTPFTLQELLQRLQTEPYPREYQEEIGNYYRTLLQQKRR